jgi:hypothetical protein
VPSDARIQQAREHHRRAGGAISEAERHRQQRDTLIRQVRAENPAAWTYTKLAAAVGCSPELIAAIVQGRRGGFTDTS